MAWIDEVVSLTGSTGTCRVLIDKNAHYCDENERLRESTAIEWIAQSYAYVGSLIGLRDRADDIKPSTKMFLVGVKDLILDPNFIRIPQNLNEVHIEVEPFRSLGPVCIVSGKVLDPKTHQIYAEGQVKVFSQ